MPKALQLELVLAPASFVMMVMETIYEHHEQKTAAMLCAAQAAVRRVARSSSSWGLPQIRGTLLGLCIIRTVVKWGLYWGPLILGNYLIALTPSWPLVAWQLMCARTCMQVEPPRNLLQAKTPLQLPRPCVDSRFQVVALSPNMPKP